MRYVRRILIGLLSAAILIVLAAGAAQNVQVVEAHLFGRVIGLSLWAVIVLCAALGLVLGALVLGALVMLPGRRASGSEVQRLSREVTRLHGVVSSLEQRHAALQAERDTMQAERDHLRMRVAQLARAASPQGASGEPVPR
jgi:hypothetical protein